MKIVEVQRLLGISSYTLRYYEKMGLVTCKRDQNGYRNYSDDDLKRIKKIIFLRELDLPIEQIIAIIDNQKDFQEVLDDHLRMIDHKIKSLKYIQEVCNELKEKELPLLDIVSDENILNENNIKAGELKSNLKKIFNYLKPVKTTVLGYRIDPVNFLSSLPFIIVATIFLVIGFVGIDKMIEYINIQLINANLTPISNYQNIGIKISVVILFFIIMTLMMSYHCSKQKYIELIDRYVSVCSLDFQTRWAIFKGMITKNMNKYNLNYHYDQIENVTIDVIFSTTIAPRAGLWRTYLLRFTFYFDDGKIFTIDSGQYFGENLRDSYLILQAKQVPIQTSEEIVEFFNQTELKMWDYFEKIYQLNTHKKHKS